MTEVAAWNAYIYANNQEPQTGTQFQRWVAHSSYRHNISYSKAYTIYDKYTGKGKIEIKVFPQSHPQSNNKLNKNDSPVSSNSRQKYVYNTQQNHYNHKQNVVQFRNNTAPNLHNYNYNPNENYNKSVTHQTQYQNNRSRTHTEYNNSYSNANKTTKMNNSDANSDANSDYGLHVTKGGFPMGYNNDDANSDNEGGVPIPYNNNDANSDAHSEMGYVNDNKNVVRPMQVTKGDKSQIRRRSNTVPIKGAGPNFLINIDHSGIKTSKHIKVYSLSPKQAKNIIPKDDLTLFLIHYDIRDLKRKLIENKIALMHLKTVETGDLNEFCLDLKLSVPDKIRFKHAVKELQKGDVGYKNGNNSYNNNAKRTKNQFGLTQSETIKYNHHNTGTFVVNNM